MKILIVDDDMTTVEALCSRISWDSLGFEPPYLAYSAEGARKILTQNSVHIMLCDIEMPRESGLELLHWIREQKIPLECIFLTNHLEFEYAQKAIKLSGLDYLSKNSSDLEIQQALKKAQKKIWDYENFHDPYGSEPMKNMPDEQSLKPEQQWKPSVPGKMEVQENWEMLLRQSHTQRLLQEVRMYLRWSSQKLPVTSETLYLFHHDFLQMVNAVLQEKGIPSHMIFEDKHMALLEKNAEKSMIELVKWVSCIIPTACELIEKNMTSTSPEQQMLDFIHENYASKIGREEITKAVHLSPEYAARIFKGKTGLSLKQYLNYYRIEKAKELMLNPSLQISEIAYMVGFEQFSYFSASFRQQENISPRQYREQLKKKSPPVQKP